MRKIIKAIYIITNLINNKKYIGQSVNPQRRFKSHLSRAKTNADNSPIHMAINEYGKENFSLDIIEWTKDYNQREKDLIIEYSTLSPKGYNIAKGGEEPPHSYGLDHHNGIISKKDLDIITNELIQNKLTQTEIGNLFNPAISQCTINSINMGITHYRENIKYPITTSSPYHLEEEQISDIIWLLKNTLYPFYQIADYFKVNTSTIKHINVGRNHYNKNNNYPIRKYRGKKQIEPVEAILAKRSTLAIDTQVETGVCV